MNDRDRENGDAENFEPGVAVPIELGDHEGYAAVAELVRERLERLKEDEDRDVEDAIERAFVYLETQLTQAFALVDMMAAEGRFDSREAGATKLSIQQGMMQLLMVAELASDDEFDPVEALDRWEEEVRG